MKKITVVITAAELDDEHHRVAELSARVELRERVPDRRDARCSREKSARGAGHHAALLVEREVELEHVDAGLAEEAEAAAVGVRRRSAGGRSRAAGRARRRCARAWRLRVGRRDVRVDAGARGRDRVDRDVADRQARVVRALELQDRRAPLPRRSWRGRGSSGRGSRTSSRRRCTRAPSPTGARGSSAGS